MLKLETLQSCSSCATKIASAEGQSNGDGTFLCLACQAAIKSAAPAADRESSPRNCTFCDQIITRKDCHRNRYGEYVCLECKKKGKRWSSRRRFFRVAKRFLKFFIIGLISVSAASGYVWLMVQIMNRISQPRPPAND